ncbi:cyclic nucleotide-binding domain-containing protein [Atopomonas sediminilitoris]|uniref:cyclic nucleotide-binding domain-containing protein n=1 Tax=Atopomonas sediminilitoris TaxID=2919919 RepID=UPI001F4EE651|nr:cyclic nucleotide-binding domain-containing protein [Atopomonas sediminilitoris]MCJ8167735.1 cyclic nucleotide-binding domain-containing protein [Atopomonas sediminilitoris]
MSKAMDVDFLQSEQLRGLVPLNALSESQWRELRPSLKIESLLAGQGVLRRGDCDQQHYYLLSGEVELADEQGNRELVMAGSLTGCHPLSPAVPRQHDARAVTDITYLRVDSALLDRLVSWRQAYQDLLLEQADSEEEQSWLESLLQSPLFRRVPVANVRPLLASLARVEQAAGTDVITQGDLGDCCYFLCRGRAQVIRDVDSDKQVLAELEEGACFGEEALLSEQPRNASVTLLEDSLLLRLDKQAFYTYLRAPLVASVSFGEAARLLAQNAQWLDVRLQDEYEQGHAHRAVNMPLHLLRLKARLLNPELTYLCYCDSGKRSETAVFLLGEMGFKAYALRGGVNDLPAVQRDALVGEVGAGYLLRSGGRIEASH